MITLLEIIIIYNILQGKYNQRIKTLANLVVALRHSAPIFFNIVAGGNLIYADRLVELAREELQRWLRIP